MPQLGETVTEGTVTRWLKAIGQSVARDEPLFEVSTDKVDSEVPSPAAGILTELRVAEGDTVAVGTVVAIVADSAGGAPPVVEAPVVAAPVVAAPVVAAPVVAAPVAPPEPAPQPASAPTPQPAPQAPVLQASSPGGEGGATTPRVLSPVVRRLLSEHAIDAGDVPGTGLGGRITRSDVLRVIDARRAGGAPAPVSPPAVPATRPTPGPTASRVGTDEIVPFTNIRRRTAEHMIRSQETSAHTLVVLEADFENVEQVRRAHRESFRAEEGFSLTYLPFVARATVEALREWPNLNASVGDDALIVHHGVNLGIAVDLNHQGLIVPVVHRAEELTLRGMARRISELARRARDRQLGADDIAGGTFSITNPGPFGTLLTSPIINQPQVGIVSTDGVKRKPVVITGADGSEAIAIHSVGLLSLAWDHRAVDGAYAAAFLARTAELLTTHDWAAEL
jgi:2-oxoglutarate dehydrogenase E2 component (dihydrolipoamide succinyltransferase)